MITKHIALALAPLALATALAACGSDAKPAAAPASSAASTTVAAASSGDRLTFVGAVPGTAYRIGIITSGGTAWAYLCDPEGHAQALNGTSSGGKLDLASPDPTITSTFTGTIGAEALTGSLTLDGTKVSIDAHVARNDDGIYTKLVKEGTLVSLSTWIRDGGSVVGNKATVQTTQTADGSVPPGTDDGPGGVVPPATPPVSEGWFKCWRATRELFKANKALAENPSAGAAANQHNASEAQKQACNF